CARSYSNYAMDFW
nr:immunoglobulin heavy chain junction region [Mus musculus]